MLPHLSLQVRSYPDNASLHSHLEGEADHSSDLQQSLLTQTPPALNSQVLTLSDLHLSSLKHQQNFTLTGSSSPSMCRMTVLALLLLEPRKN